MELSKENVIAVVGATVNKDKYGYKVLMRLRELGYANAVGVNPKYEEIDGVGCFGSLDEVMPMPDMAVMVVPPEVTEKMVEKCGELGIKTVWMQPGSESDEAVSKAEEMGLEVVQACIVTDGLGEGWGKYES